MDIFSVIHYLPKLGVHLDQKLLHNELFNHHRFGTIYSFTDCLNRLNIENYPVSLTLDEIDPETIPVISTLTKNDESELIILKKITADKIVYIIDNNKEIEESVKIFKSHWSGFLIYIIPNKIRVADKIIMLKNYFFYSFIIIALLLTILLSFPSNILSGLCLLGFYISFLLDKQSKGEENALTSKICMKNKIVDCNKVLSSKAASIFNIKMSDIGAIYFIIGLLTIILNEFISSNNSLLNVFCSLSIFSIGYVSFSFFYQIFIVKKVCTLCLSIISILVLQATISLYRIEQITSNMSINVVVLFIFISAIVCSLYYYISLLINRELELSDKYREYFSIKRNYNVYKALLQQDSSEINIPNLSYYIILGNRDSSKNMTIILSFFCPACSILFSEINKWLIDQADDIKVIIYFDGIQEEDSISKKLFAHLLNSYAENPMTFAEELKIWYENSTNKESAYYKKIENIVVPKERNFSINDDIQIWANTIKIEYTPTIVINKKILPPFYQISDLEYFMSVEP